MNELRYLGIADEALQKGEVFAFTSHGTPYADKPPLYIWLVMLLKTIFGKHNIFPLTLLSFIPSVIMVAVMDKWLRLGAAEKGKTVDPLTRIAAALMLFTSGMFFGTCIFLRMDPMMAMFIMLSLFSFYKAYKGIGNVKLQKTMFPIWLFLALFTKGPIGLLMPLISVLCFLIVRHQGSKIKEYLGLRTFAILVGLCLIWFAGVYREGGIDYLYNLTIHQTMGRAFNSFAHKKPFYFYFVAIFVNLLPYFLILIPIIIEALFKKKEGQDRTDAEALFLCTICCTFLMLSSFSSKLPIYLLPIVPFLVYCVPLEVMRRGWGKWMGSCLLATIFIFILIGSGGIFILKHPEHFSFMKTLSKAYPLINSQLILYGFMILLAAGILALATFISNKSTQKAIIYLASGILLFVYSGSFEIKLINPYIGYGAICKKIPETTEVSTLFMSRPENMSVYLNREITNYDKDVNSFLSSEKQYDTKEETNKALIITTERIAQYPELAYFIKEKSLSDISEGPYTIIFY
jgi:4-amino-4-deoxy-L-arabinose transferase-like glycosyltransferase